MKQNNHSKRLPGFYIAICGCVVAIGFAGFIVQNNETESTNTPATAEESTIPYYEKSIELTEDENIISPSTVPEQTAENVIIEESVSVNAEPDYTYNNPDIVSVSSVVYAEENHIFCDPIAEMTIKFGYCGDKLIYNEVYGDWRTHNGIDIEAPIGCSVMATAQGTIKDISMGSYGQTIKIEHDNGFMSVYAPIQAVNVAVGETIEQGAVIGTVGESVGENIKEPHLHYELLKDNINVNPEEY